MFDTVTFAEDLGPLDAGKLLRSGWTVTETKKPTGVVSERAFCNPEADEVQPRLTWYESGYVAAECSLPKLLRGENVTLIREADLPDAFRHVSDYVSEKVDAAVDVAEWNLSRVDYCYTWSVGDEALPLYLQALNRLHLSRHNRQGVDASSVTWHSKANKLLFYDKYKESGLDVARGVLRLEACVRNTHYLAEKRLNTERTARALLTDENALTTLAYFLSRLGLSGEQPIMSRSGFLAALIKRFGVTGAEKLLLFARLYEAYGSDLAGGLYQKRTYYRRRKVLAEVGLLTYHDGDLELPALRIG